MGTAWEQAFGASAAEFDSAIDGTSDRVRPRHHAAVICPTCDEVFRPTFARRCTGCKHDFGQDDAANARTVGRLSGETASRSGRRSALQTARMILAVVAAVAVIYTLYDWLMSNTGGARLF